MIRLLGIILGVGGLIATSTSVAVAQSNDRIIVRNGERYLDNIESRSVEDDFEQFFWETSPETTFIYNYPDYVESSPLTEETPQILEDIRFETDDISDNAFDIFPNSRSGDVRDAPRVLYEFEQW
ncbi:hypothetical protein PCC7424_1273 [Gloeothece citriformis PCC 7424]|uniref:Uncharacterized protein n=1 Tax=Gloeothece citriformis (strain PCC 7424) TaxID=65393 RepID=B7K7F2_GLOC7|nr:hypothetical protein [Gloeothece citriformis]ACK69720.1 hypothetical protein PCC7424_1273 [Gloeothece citriformis PCC 7424]